LGRGVNHRACWRTPAAPTRSAALRTGLQEVLTRGAMSPSPEGAVTRPHPARRRARWEEAGACHFPLTPHTRPGPARPGAPLRLRLPPSIGGHHQGGSAQHHLPSPDGSRCPPSADIGRHYWGDDFRSTHVILLIRRWTFISLSTGLAARNAGSSWHSHTPTGARR
jgi:hypothetical protein